MWKLIFIGLAIWIAFHLIKRSMGQSPIQNSDKANTQNKDTTEDMVECATCSVHLPRSEAFLVVGSFYCCKDHIKTE
jgi:uncharacterized protein